MHPNFVMAIGGSASGKNKYVDTWYSHLPLIDIDEIILNWSDGDPNKDRVNMISPAIRESKQRMADLFEFQKSFAHVSTGTGFKGVLNKFLAAKKAGFITRLIIVETSDTIAIERNHQRIKNGGHGKTITDNKVRLTNFYARQNFMRLINFDCVDFYGVYNND